VGMRLAFAGFRHSHIFSLYRQAKEMDEIEIVAACEEDEAAREAIGSEGRVQITHTDIDTMLSEVDCDAVAVGDYYGKRGSIIIKALLSGRHVISDKPICTSLEELDRIEEICGASGLKVGCMLDMRDMAQFIGVRNLVRQGTIGEVHAINFGGQHPLMFGTRPMWYFEPGKHGGTINDIGVHAFDLIPWITGMRFSVINAARSWNAFARDYPHFKDAGQMMLTMENGCGVLGDVSYFSPDSLGYSLPFYWRMTFFGRRGIIETSCTARNITLALDTETSVRYVELPDPNPAGYLRSFMADVAGDAGSDTLTTRSVLNASRIALTVQKAGDDGLRELELHFPE